MMMKCANSIYHLGWSLHLFSTSFRTSSHGIHADEIIVKSYSIKSFIGSPPTLLNASGQTKILFTISPALNDHDVESVNSITIEPVIANRLASILSERVISFERYSSTSFYRNLLLLDVGMPDLLATLTLAYYMGLGRTLKELTEYVAAEDVLQLRQSDNLALYKFKVKHLISEISLGMTPGREWYGETSVSGGIIVVNKISEVLCYEADDRDKFREYLYSHLRFETPSKRKHNFGSLVNDDGHSSLSLCIQLRF